MADTTPEPKLITLYSPEGESEVVQEDSERFTELRGLDWKLRAPKAAKAPANSGTTTSTPGPKEGEEETVAVPKTQLDKLFKMLDDQAKDLDMLKSVADVGRVDRYKAAHLGVRPKYVRLSVYNGRFVLGWATLSNKVQYDTETETVSVDQVTEMVLEPKGDEPIKKVRVPYQIFGTEREKVVAEVVSTQTEADGRQSFNVKVVADGNESFPDFVGRELKIDSQFVN